MGKLAYARSHRDLIVYQKTRSLANEIFKVTKSFPKEETYSLTDQIRRASRSVGAQVAEAWAKRRYEKHFITGHLKNTLSLSRRTPGRCEGAFVATEESRNSRTGDPSLCSG